MPDSTSFISPKNVDLRQLSYAARYSEEELKINHDDEDSERISFYSNIGDSCVDHKRDDAFKTTTYSSLTVWEEQKMAIFLDPEQLYRQESFGDSKETNMYVFDKSTYS